MQRSRSLSAALAIALSGCAATPPNFSGVMQRGRASANEIEEAYKQALAYCDSQMSTLRRAYTGAGEFELGIAAVGIVAGSLVVPALAAKAAASKAAVAAWGGVSGAANAGQLALQSKGASEAAQAAIYTGVRIEIKSGMADYASATTDAGRLLAVQKIAFACRYPPAPEITPAS